MRSPQIVLKSTLVCAFLLCSQSPAFSESPNALFSGVYKNDVARVQVALDGGLSVNIKNERGVTPLIMAAQYGHFDMVRILVEYYSADLNLFDNNGYTALIWAAQEGRTEIVRYLLSKGADTSAKEKRGMTAGMWAAKQNHSEIVTLLREKEAKSASNVGLPKPKEPDTAIEATVKGPIGSTLVRIGQSKGQVLARLATTFRAYSMGGNDVFGGKVDGYNCALVPVFAADRLETVHVHVFLPENDETSIVGAYGDLLKKYSDEKSKSIATVVVRDANGKNVLKTIQKDGNIFDLAVGKIMDDEFVSTILVSDGEGVAITVFGTEEMKARNVKTRLMVNVFSMEVK